MNAHIPTPDETRAPPSPEAQWAIQRVLAAFHGGKTRYVVRCDDWSDDTRAVVTRRFSERGWRVCFDDGLHGSTVSVSEPETPTACTFRVEGAVHSALDVKRLYFPGVVIRDVCPKCGGAWERDYGSNSYLSYPTVGTPFDLTLYCGECNHEWERRVRLDITLVAVP